MDPEHLAQAVRLRRLRADKAGRALREARAREARAVEAVAAARRALKTYDAEVEARIAAYYEKALGGVRPEALLGARAFHADLVEKRAGYVSAIREAEKRAAAARKESERARAFWAEKERSAEKLHDLREDMARRAAKQTERRTENDADDLSAARARRPAE